MPFHQKVDTEARLTRMIEDMGITLHPKQPQKEEKKEKQLAKKEKDEKE